VPLYAHSLDSYTFCLSIRIITVSSEKRKINHSSQLISHDSSLEMPLNLNAVRVCSKSNDEHVGDSTQTRVSSLHSLLMCREEALEKVK
jgi:hypothetical protein